MMPSSVPISIGDYAVLPITIPALPSFPVKTTHYVYVSQYRHQTLTKDASRKLFVANVPADSTATHIQSLFTRLVGPNRFVGVTFDDDHKADMVMIEPSHAIQLANMTKKRKRDAQTEHAAGEEEIARLPSTWTRKLHRSGCTAVVQLVDDRSVEFALKAILNTHAKRTFPVWGEGVDHANCQVPPLGCSWIKAHDQLSFPHSDDLTRSINSFFTVFNRKEKEAAELAKRLRNEPDEDGFVMVTRGSSHVAAARPEEAEEAKRRMLEKEAKKSKSLNNFYRFATKEQRKLAQQEQQRLFREDLKQVNELRRKKGKFKPET